MKLTERVYLLLVFALIFTCQTNMAADLDDKGVAPTVVTGRVSAWPADPQWRISSGALPPREHPIIKQLIIDAENLSDPAVTSNWGVVGPLFELAASEIFRPYGVTTKMLTLQNEASLYAAAPGDFILSIELAKSYRGALPGSTEFTLAFYGLTLIDPATKKVWWRGSTGGSVWKPLPRAGLFWDPAAPDWKPKNTVEAMLLREQIATDSAGTNFAKKLALVLDSMRLLPVHLTTDALQNPMYAPTAAELERARVKAYDNSQWLTKLEVAKEKCLSRGLKPQTEPFGKCTLATSK